MLTEKEILFTLDNYRNGHDPAFVELGHPYVFPIDSRISLFTNKKDKWALAIEVLGYNPRSEPVALEITFFGNCLINLEYVEDYYSNSYCVFPIDEESFNHTIESETLKQNAEFWIVRGEKLKLSHLKKDYETAGIELKEYEPNEISAEEVGRLLVTKHRDLFRATNDELYKSIPKDLEKILVIDEWHHRDFYQNNLDYAKLMESAPTIDQLKEAFENNSYKLQMPEEVFMNAFDFNKHDENRIELNKKERELNSPGSYETWQLIAKVLVTGDTSLYDPKLEPTSHWKNWPNAGTM